MRARPGSGRGQRNPRGEHRRPARRAPARPRGAPPAAQPRLGGVPRKRRGRRARRTAHRLRGRGRRARPRGGTHSRAARRLWRGGEDRLAAAQPPQDRPDPDERSGRIRRRRASPSCWRRCEARLREHALDGLPAAVELGEAAAAEAGLAGRPRDERRQAHRDRPHRQVGLRPLVPRASVAARHRTRAGPGRGRRARTARRPCQAATRCS